MEAPVTPALNRHTTQSHCVINCNRLLMNTNCLIVLPFLRETRNVNHESRQQQPRAWEEGVANKLHLLLLARNGHSWWRLYSSLGVHFFILFYCYAFLVLFGLFSIYFLSHQQEGRPLTYPFQSTASPSIHIRNRGFSILTIR